MFRFMPQLTDWFGSATAMTMRTTIRQVLLDLNDQEALEKHPRRG
jgi:DNA-binding GntR family transcriptional regulator